MLVLQSCTSSRKRHKHNCEIRYSFPYFNRSKLFWLKKMYIEIFWLNAQGLRSTCIHIFLRTRLNACFIKRRSCIHITSATLARSVACHHCCRYVLLTFRLILSRGERIHPTNTASRQRVCMTRLVEVFIEPQLIVVVATRAQPTSIPQGRCPQSYLLRLRRCLTYKILTNHFIYLSTSLKIGLYLILSYTY